MEGQLKALLLELEESQRASQANAALLGKVRLCLPVCVLCPCLPALLPSAANAALLGKVLEEQAAAQSSLSLTTEQLSSESRRAHAMEAAQAAAQERAERLHASHEVKRRSPACPRTAVHCHESCPWSSTD